MTKKHKTFLIRQTPNAIIYLGNSRLDSKGNVIFLQKDKEKLVIKMYRKLLEGKSETWFLTKEGSKTKIDFLNSIRQYYK
jgi:hypothetical protein